VDPIVSTGGAVSAPLVLDSLALSAQVDGPLVGLTGGAHILLAVVTLVAIGFVLRMVRRGQMAGKYAVVWMAATIPLGLLAAFPGALTWLAEAVGVFYPPALFLLMAVAFLFLIVVQFSYELSRLTERTRALAEEVALLRAERDASER
jgi:hypothetical protein